MIKVHGRPAIRSVVSHYYASELHVVTICGVQPRGPLQPEGKPGTPRTRCNACAERLR